LDETRRSSAGYTVPSDDVRDDRVAEVVQAGKDNVRIEKTVEWRLAVTLAWVVLLHLLVAKDSKAHATPAVKLRHFPSFRAILTLITVVFMLYFPNSHPLTTTYTSLLSISASLLAVLQYAPQIIRTYRAKVIGALSIGTMLIQVPGSVVFCVSLAGREGVRWDAWGVYAVTGLMQAALLVSPLDHVVGSEVPCS
jgi:hypothetical protein